MDDYSVDGSARCPHCGFSVQFTYGDTEVLHMQVYWTEYSICWVECPHCHDVIITLMHQPRSESPKTKTLIYPLSSQRPPVPNDVPAPIRAGYDQAAKTLRLSPNASAALSRRCMQAVLEGAGQIGRKSLYNEIGEAIPGLPKWLGQMLDDVRNIGNFGAHANQDVDSGVIVDVEPDEAEWTLDVLDRLFEFYYALPAAASHTRELVNKNLIATGQHTVEEQRKGAPLNTTDVTPKT